MPSHPDRVRRNYQTTHRGLVPITYVPEGALTMACPMCQRGEPCGWNVIEGEHFDTGRDHGDETT